MKATASFVNAARGPICDTDAPLRALEQKNIASAILDVTDPEPLPAEHSLFGCEDVVIMPHVGSATVETRTRVASRGERTRVAAGKPLLTPVA